MKYNTDTMDFRERMDRFASRGTIWGGKGKSAYKALVAEVNKLREEAYAEGVKHVMSEQEQAIRKEADKQTNALIRLQVKGLEDQIALRNAVHSQQAEVLQFSLAACPGDSKQQE